MFYSLSILMALISNIIVSTLLFKKYYYTLEELIGLLFYENVGLICGAKKLAYWLSNSKEPFNFINAGLSAYGAIFGASFFIILFCFQFHKSIKETFLLLAPSFPLMYSIGKIGCFIAGCCYGINYNGLFKIIYKHSKSAPNNVYLFPVQLIESIIFLNSSTVRLPAIDSCIKPSAQTAVIVSSLEKI